MKQSQVPLFFFSFSLFWWCWVFVCLFDRILFGEGLCVVVFLVNWLVVLCFFSLLLQ